MPFTIKYDAEQGGVVISGIILPGEQKDFVAKYTPAIQDMSRAYNEEKENKKAKKHSNWHSQFVRIIRYAQSTAPDNNEYNLPDPYGFKDAGIRMWRAISNASFVDAKAHIESIIKGSQSYPSGFEYGDIPDEAMSEAARLYEASLSRVG
jgi:hypothetical protein